MSLVGLHQSTPGYMVWGGAVAALSRLSYKSDEDTFQSIAGGTCADLLTRRGRGQMLKDTTRICTSSTLAKYCKGETQSSGRGMWDVWEHETINQPTNQSNDRQNNQLTKGLTDRPRKQRTNEATN